jgi:hypothetical protein
MSRQTSLGTQQDARHEYWRRFNSMTRHRVLKTQPGCFRCGNQHEKISDTASKRLQQTMRINCVRLPSLSFSCSMHLQQRKRLLASDNLRLATQQLQEINAKEQLSCPTQEQAREASLPTSSLNPAPKLPQADNVIGPHPRKIAERIVRRFHAQVLILSKLLIC